MITVQRRLLKEACASLSKISNKANVLQILDTFQLVTDGNTLIISATNLTISGKARIPVETKITDIAACVDALLFTETINLCTDDEFKLEIGPNNQFIISTDKGKYKTGTQDPNDFPNMHFNLKEAIAVPWEWAQIHKILNEALNFISHQSTELQNFTNIRMVKVEDTLQISATNKQILYIKELDAPKLPVMDILVPKTTLVFIKGLPDKEWKFFIDGALLYMISDSLEFKFVMNTPNNYPDLNRVLYKDFSHNVALSPKDLKIALRPLRTFFKKADTMSMDMKVSEKNLKLLRSTQTEDATDLFNQSAEETVYCHSANSFGMRVNPENLAACLSFMDDDEIVMSVSGSKPIIISRENDTNKVLLAQMGI